MNSSTPSVSGLHSQQFRKYKHFNWPEKIHKRFQFKIYTYYPKSQSKTNQKPVNTSQLSQNDSVPNISTKEPVKQCIDLTKQVEKIDSENEVVEESKLKHSEEQNKPLEDDKKEDKGDTRQLTPIRVNPIKMDNVEAVEIVSSVISLGEESGDSQWVDPRKKARQLKEKVAKKVKKHKRKSKSRRIKKAAAKIPSKSQENPSEKATKEKIKQNLKPRPKGRPKKKEDKLANVQCQKLVMEMY